MNQESYVHVAVGVLLNDRDEVLVSLRSQKAHQGGLWEFPGGKLEDDESTSEALVREFEEELGITVSGCTPLMQIRHDYGDKSVLLDVWNIAEFSGVPSGREGQAVEWRALAELRAVDFPVANGRIIRALQLPSTIAITPEAQDFSQLQQIIRSQLQQDVGLIYFRQKALDAASYLDWFTWADEQCRRNGVRLMYCHPTEDIASATLPDCQVLHLNSRQLCALTVRPISADQLLSVSCHNLEELRQAEDLDADFALLSPVCKTDKYLESELLGWDKFQALAAQVNLPVFALGGMTADDLPISRQHQGFGIAGISAFVRP